MKDASIYDIGIEYSKDTVYGKEIELIGFNKNVLEFGCSTGFVSKMLKQRGCRITGIEIDENAAKKAREYCEKVVVGDIDTMELDKDLDHEKFDVALFGDILEHLKNPKKILLEVKKFLTKEGYLVISIPNIAHWSIRLELLNGNFDYQKFGILDDSHLRFFTKRGIINLLESSGYFIEALDYVKQELDWIKIFHILKTIGFDENESRKIYLILNEKDAEAFQYVIKAIVCSEYKYLEKISNEKISLEQEIWQKNFVITEKDNHIHNLETSIQNKDNHIHNLETSIQNKDNHIHNLETSIDETNKKLNTIYSSTAWQLFTKFQRLVNITFPPTSKRRHIYDMGIISIRLIVNNGFSTFLYKLKEKIYGVSINASNIPIVETNIADPHLPKSLAKSLSGRFTFTSINLNEIRILTATYLRENSDLMLYVTNIDGKILRKATVKGHLIKDNYHTSFKFKPIRDSKGKDFFFKLISEKEPSAEFWHNGSITLPELTLFYDEQPLKGSIGFQAFADIEIKSRYDFWILKNEPTKEKLEQYKKEIKEANYQPKISIITPVYNPEVEWIKTAIESVKNQVYANWELCLADASTKQDVKKCLEEFAKKDTRIKVKFLTENKGISGNSNEALSLATGEFIGFLDHDDELAYFALYEVVKLLNQNPDLDFIYSDEDKLDATGKRCDSFFKPNWSPDLLLSCMYTCHFGVYRKKIIDNIGGFRLGYEGSQDYDLVLRFIEFTDSNKIAHIPKILYHWRKVPGSIAGDPIAKNRVNIISAKKALNDALVRRNIKGKVKDGKWLSSYRIKRDILGNPKVSIIIPTKDQLKFFKNCIDSIKQKTTYKNYELIVVDNNSIESETIKYINDLDCIKLNFKDNFNFSRINNLAAGYANGDYIIFLNNDIEIITDDWIQSMLEHAQREEVGAVGCKLLYPDRTIQHAGVVLGLSPDPRNKVAGHIFIKSNNVDHGYFGLIDTIRNYSAVTAAAMMIRKDVFNEVGGFDEKITVSYNDVDLCLRIRERGYLIVYTPFVELFHYESASRGNNLNLTEVQYMVNKWGDILKQDPYYNPNLSLNSVNCEVNI